MHHEPQVGLIEAHAEGTGRHEGLNAVLLKGLLGGHAFVRVGLAGVSEHVVAAGAQGGCGILRRRNGQRVDDTRAG